MARLPRQTSDQRQRFFAAEGVDELLSMVLELTAEVATLRERQYVTERVLEKHGIDMANEIEGYELSTKDESVLADERDRLLETVLRSTDVTNHDASALTPFDADSADQDSSQGQAA